MLLDAGIDDWGGVSPVTADHVNPERPWPALDRLREVTEARGLRAGAPAHDLPRVRARPRPLARPDDCASRCSTAATPRASAATTPARCSRRTSARSATSATAPRSCSIGRRSTAWYSGADVAAAGARARRPARGRAARSREVLDGVLLGQEPGEDEIVTLFSRPRARGRRRRRGGRRAAPRSRRRRRHLRAQPQHQLHERLHVQVPVLRLLQGPAVAEPARHARTCSRSTTSPAACAEAWSSGATEVCLQGGIHPDFDGDYYIDVTRAVKEAAPDIHVHGFTALEVTEGAKRLGEPLDRLPAPAHGRRPARRCPAPRPRSSTTRSAPILCPDKINTEEWLDAHRTAHSVGLRSNVTIMFGVGRAARALGPPPGAHPRPAEGDRRVHRVRAAAVRAHGGADLPAAQGPPRPDVPRGRAHARGRPHRLPRARSTTSRRRG